MRKIFFLLLLAVAHGFSAYAQWTTTQLSEAKAQMGAASLDNKIWIAGGTTTTNHLKKVEIYDASTGTWTSSQLSTWRAFPAGASAQSKVFFAGGLNVVTLETFSVVDIWDTLTKQWSVAQLSQPRFSIATASSGDKVMFAGGSSFLTNTTNIVDIYDVPTNTWSVDYLSEARAAMGSAVVETAQGKIAIFAGGFKIPSLTVSDRVDIYHFSTNTWSTATLSLPRGFVAATSVDGKILIAGGMTNNNMPSDRVDIFDPETNEWTISNLSQPRAFLENAASACGKAFFAGGGIMDLTTTYWETSSKTVDIFDAASETWSVDSLSNSVVNHVVIATGDKVFIAGGINVNNPVQINYSTVDIFQCTVDANEQVDVLRDIQLFPNPANNNMTLLATNKVTGWFTFSRTDGTVVIRKKMLAETQREFSIAGLPPGIYYWHIVTDNGSQISGKQVVIH